MKDEAARDTRKRRFNAWMELDFEKGKYKKGNIK